jgi:hypothetical protein
MRRSCRSSEQRAAATCAVHAGAKRVEVQLRPEAAALFPLGLVLYRSQSDSR